MFGPNKLTEQYRYSSHREEYSLDLVEKTKTLFKEKYNLDEYDIIFFPGSGSSGVQAVMESLKQPIQVIGDEEGKFTNRWKSLAVYLNKFKKLDAKPIQMSCHLETSTSNYQPLDTPILDAVSSFPYYSIPKTAQVFITSSNKQLGSDAGVAIIGVRQDS